MSEPTIQPGELWAKKEQIAQLKQEIQRLDEETFTIPGEFRSQLKPEAREQRKQCRAKIRKLEQEIAGVSSENAFRWGEVFGDAVCSATELRELPMPAREHILGSWFREGDLGFIFGQRGLGKTWFALFLARACAEGVDFGPWKAGKGRTVLYVDGEMAKDDICQRDAVLTRTESGRLLYLQHEALFHKHGKTLNLTAREAQAGLLEVCEKRGVSMLCLDNLSCLFAGMKENDADDWEQVLPWLLEMRRRRIAVVIIHHAGRNGQMRGTSRREDAAFWVIQLSEGKTNSEPETGARFVARFAKNRNGTESDCPPMEWQFRPSPGESHLVVEHRNLTNLQLFRQLVEDGLTGATDIAEEMGITKGAVSKMAKKASAEGWLSKDNGKYVIVSKVASVETAKETLGNK